MGPVVLGGLIQRDNVGNAGRNGGRGSRPPSGDPQPVRLIAWATLVGLLALASYGSRFTSGKPPENLLYQWSTFLNGVIQYGIMLILTVAIAGGLNRPLLALEYPKEPKKAAGFAVVALGVILAAAAATSAAFDAGREQGLVPTRWDSGHAAAFFANAVVVVIAAPIVEELLFRGLGIGLLLEFFGPVLSIAVTGITFGLAHGLILGLLVLSIFGATLGWLRWKTGSVYPGMIVHGCFNASALVVAVAL